MESNANVIGRGTFGIVVLTGGHPKIAAKYIIKGQTAIFKKEHEAMEKLSHPNIVKFYGFDEDEYFNVIKMEYCERNSLLQILDDPTIIYSMVTAICWGEHMFAALKHLEKVGILHRDIKPGNVLVDHKFILKLADFGCVRDSKSTKSVTSAGTLRYMSPETAGALGNLQPTLLSDVYAVGLVLWEIIERRRVYSEYSLNHFGQQSLFRDLRDKRIVFSDPNFVHDGIKDFIRRSTSFYPNDRPGNDESLAFWSNLREKSGIETFLPIIDPRQKRLIRPIGFDGTLNRVPLEEDWMTLSLSTSNFTLINGMQLETIGQSVSTQTDLANVLKTDQNLKSVITKMLTERETLKAIKNGAEYSLRVLVLIDRLIVYSREIPNRPLFSLAMPAEKFKKIISPSSLRVSIHQLASNITFKAFRCMADACLKMRSRLDDMPRLFIEVIELLQRSSDQDMTQSSVARIETLISMIKSAAYDCYVQTGYPKGDFNERLEELNELCQAEIAQRVEEVQIEVPTPFHIIHEIREKWAYLDDFSRHLRWKTDELGKTMNILAKYSKEDLLKEKIMPTILKSINFCFEVMDLVEIYSHISTKYIALNVKRMERVLSETNSNLNMNEIEDNKEIESLINEKQEEFKMRFQSYLTQIMNILY